MINGKKKGNAYECLIANEMSGKYNQKIYTNRFINKRADGFKVDLSTKDFNIQCKSTKNNIPYSKIIKDMENAGYQQEKINVIFSKITPRKGEFAILRKEDFYTILDNYIQSNSSDNAKAE